MKNLEKIWKFLTLIKSLGDTVRFSNSLPLEIFFGFWKKLQFYKIRNFLRLVFKLMRVSNSVAMFPGFHVNHDVFHLICVSNPIIQVDYFQVDFVSKLCFQVNYYRTQGSMVQLVQDRLVQDRKILKNLGSNRTVRTRANKILKIRDRTRTKKEIENRTWSECKFDFFQKCWLNIKFHLIAWWLKMSFP